ncbi:hypothetical protein BDV23DRAFT_164499 [Aspergillus alliaceus]|uniref:Uncharacterized protein n=2 Tax=Petromyces alliaceus TaxID=209559 RepID=A0A5N7BW47_PETAA|nr:hypothetical protein BDV23DRAFT_164499 [Aspergillus alliaceus]
MSGSIETLTRPSSFFVRHASRTTTRIHSIARRSASPFPCRMVILSHDKLHRESAAKNPDLRRCLGHQRLLRHSIEVAQKDMKKAMAPFRLDDSGKEDDGISGDGFSNSPSPIIREQITKAVKAMVKRRAASQTREPDNTNAAPRLIRMSTKNTSSCELASSRQPNTFYKVSSVTTKRSKPSISFAFTRHLWSSGQSMQTIGS